MNENRIKGIIRMLRVPNLAYELFIEDGNRLSGNITNRQVNKVN